MYGDYIRALKLYSVVIAFIISVSLFSIVNFVTERPETEAMSEKNYGNSIEIALPTKGLNFILKPISDGELEGTATPDSSESPSVTATLTRTESPSLVSPSPEASIEPSVEPTPEPSPTPTPSPKPTPKPSPTVLPSSEPSYEPTENQTAQPTQTAGDVLYGTNGYMWPTLSRRVTSPFGMRDGKLHKGTDIGGVTAGVEGDPIFAAEDGEVVVSFFGVSGSGYGGYGEVVVIQHDDGYRTLYAHCSKRYAKVGDKVKKGDIIAAMGNTGNSFGVHLHFGVMYDGSWIDPVSFFPDI